jgi:hypothetical protein
MTLTKCPQEAAQRLFEEHTALIQPIVNSFTLRCVGPVKSVPLASRSHALSKRRLQRVSRAATFALVTRVATTCPLQRQSQLITFELDAHPRGSTPSLPPATAAAT